MALIKKYSPWFWIPTIYLSEGLPYFAVNTLTVILYVNMGIGMKEMAFFTGWLYLPWVIKPFWSPFVDIFKTKRWWILAMQFILGFCFAAIAFCLPTSHFFSLTLAFFWLSAFFSATHDIAADGFYILALKSHLQAAFVGVRSTFYRIASVLGQGVLVMAAGELEIYYKNVGQAWQIIFLILSGWFFLIFIYHLNFLPTPQQDNQIIKRNFKSIWKEFVETFVTFFQKPHFWSAIIFMLLYRLPEALCLKLIQPFLLSPRNEGGLALTTSQLGFVNGTVGVIAILLGGILGGVTIARSGLKKCLFPMALCLTLPCFLYCLLALYQPDNIVLISLAVFVEQFGYGFGFTSYMLYLIYFSSGQLSTSHYAFCTAFMALGMMVPGMMAGYIFEYFKYLDPSNLAPNSGFINFFWIVMASCVVTFLVTFIIKVDPDFGKKGH